MIGRLRVELSNGWTHHYIVFELFGEILELFHKLIIFPFIGELKLESRLCALSSLMSM